VLDFISYNRFNTFIERLLVVRKTQFLPSYVDNSANGLFTGPAGTILQKRGNIFSYKYPNDSDFTVINYTNNTIERLCNNYSVVLNGGVNKNVTWVKKDNSPGTKWENKGVSSQICVICEISPASPCVTPIISYVIPTPTPYTYGNLGDIIVGTLNVTTLIIDSNTPCPPTSAGSFGQVSVCENYLYIYDGVEWKRFELSTYY
jgi:hypothetical protein